MKRARWLLLIAILIYACTGIAQIRPEERGVVRRFGKVVAFPGPGLWIGLPWGIDRVDRIAVRTIRQLEVGFREGDEQEGYYLTGDQNLVQSRLIVEYAVSETETDLTNYLMVQDRIDGILSREVESLIVEWYAGTVVDDVLLTGRAVLPQWVGQRITERITTLQIGIVVQRISVEYLSAPAEVRDAFEQVNRAQTMMSTRENQARLDASVRMRDADALKFRLEQESQAYRQEQIGLAKAEADSFRLRLDQYRKLRVANPAIRDAIWWDEMGRILLSMKNRSRIELLDQYLGKDGLDITQFLPPKRK